MAIEHIYWLPDYIRSTLLDSLANEKIVAGVQAALQDNMSQFVSK